MLLSMPAQLSMTEENMSLFTPRNQGPYTPTSCRGDSFGLPYTRSQNLRLYGILAFLLIFGPSNTSKMLYEVAKAHKELVTCLAEV